MPDKIKILRPAYLRPKAASDRREPKRDPLKREISRRVYNSTNWQRLRSLHLSENPICVQCGDPGEHVDHITPISRGGAWYDQANLQTMCHGCHSRKTWAEFNARDETEH